MKTASRSTVSGLHPFALFAVSAALAACGGSDPAGDQGDGSGSPEPSKPVVYVSNGPLHYFAGRIGGDSFDLRFPVPGDIDPAFWEPSDEAVIDLQSADRILLNGATYEKWLERRSLPPSLLVDTSRAFRGELIATEHGVEHSHGPGGEHSHAGTAFTTWMDFQQALWQAEEVRDALVALVPDEKEAILARFEELAGDLDALHSEFREVGEAIGDEPLVASHPVYPYFARRYGLGIEAVHWEPETVPDEEAFAELESLLESHPARWMIWEGEPVAESVAKLEAIGVASLVVDPCGNRPDEGDWLSVMRGNLENLRKIASASPAAADESAESDESL